MKQPRVVKRRPSAATVIALLALLLVLPGPADAARRLLTGDDIQDNSLTGADVLESSLGKVGDADTVDSMDSSDFVRTSKLKLYSVTQTQFTQGCRSDAVLGQEFASMVGDPVFLSYETNNGIEVTVSPVRQQNFFPIGDGSAGSYDAGPGIPYVVCSDSTVNLFPGLTYRFLVVDG